MTRSAMARLFKPCGGKAALLAVAVVLGMGQAHAQLYTWKDAQGVTHYSDQPPPAAGAKVRKVDSAASAPAAAELPYALSLAVRQHPVTLFTMPACKPCDDGRALLRARGVPFSEKTVATAEDRAALLAAGGNEEMSFLRVGRSATRGYLKSAWQRALDAAGYPASSQLPRSYVHAPAQPAGGAQPAPAARPTPQRAPARTVTPPPAPTPPPPSEAPSGIQF